MLNTRLREMLIKHLNVNITKSYRTEYPTTKEVEKKTDGSINYDIEYQNTQYVTPDEMKKHDETPTPIIDGKNVLYSGLQQLKKNPISGVNMSSGVSICMFRIDNSSVRPFLQFSLKKEKNALVWPTINMKDNTIGNAIEQLKKKFKKEDTVITYEGVFEHNKQKQLWFRYSTKTDYSEKKKT